MVFKAKSGSDGKSPIYCRITIEGRRAEFSTGKRVEASNWETKPGIAKGKIEEAMHINKELTKIKSDLQRTFDRLEAVQQRVTAEMLRNTYHGVGPENKLMSEAWKEYNAILLQRVNAKEPTLKEETWERFEIAAGKVTAFFKHKYNTSDKLLRDVKDTLGDDLLHYLTTVDNLLILNHLPSLYILHV